MREPSQEFEHQVASGGNTWQCSRRRWSWNMRPYGILTNFQSRSRGRRHTWRGGTLRVKKIGMADGVIMACPEFDRERPHECRPGPGLTKILGSILTACSK